MKYSKIRLALSFLARVDVADFSSVCLLNFVIVGYLRLPKKTLENTMTTIFTMITSSQA